METGSKKKYAIGVFDSGLGGLTVAKEIMRQLPSEDIVYFGDTARVPYGTKSKESIIRFSKQNVGILLKHKVKVIVVACNTSSSYALNALKENFTLPIIGVIKPGARCAVGTTRNKKIGVIATTATINSQAYTKEIKKLERAAKVVSRACPLFVPLAEEGWNERRVTEDIVREYLLAVKNAGVDTLILGCTHYPLLKNVIGRVMGRKVKLVDSAQAVALEVKELLEDTGLARGEKHKARYEFLISDQPQHFRKLARRFLGYDIKNVKKVSV